MESFDQNACSRARYQLRRSGAAKGTPRTVQQSTSLPEWTAVMTSQHGVVLRCAIERQAMNNVRTDVLTDTKASELAEAPRGHNSATDSSRIRSNSIINCQLVSVAVQLTCYAVYTVLSCLGVVYLLYMLYFKMSCVYCCKMSCVYCCSCLVCIVVSCLVCIVVSCLVCCSCIVCIVVSCLVCCSCLVCIVVVVLCVLL